MYGRWFGWWRAAGEGGLRTPQGQFLGAVALTVSADGTLVGESINV